MNELRKKTFKNGVVYCLQLEDGFLVETTDTFLPYYTKDAIGRHQNKLDNNELGDRTERWMIGVSTMSGCPVRCKFCATGKLETSPDPQITAKGRTLFRNQGQADNGYVSQGRNQEVQP